MRKKITAVAALLVASSGAQAITSSWWDTDYTYRQNVAVQTGANTPERGYAGYTLRSVGLDTQALISTSQMRSDCNDLRVLFFDGVAWQELDRHVLGCNTTQTDIRFASPVALAGASTEDNFYIYYGNATAGAPAALATSNVYLWFDDASVNRSASYIRGRVDNFHGNGWDNSLVYNAAGYYTYSTGDNFTSGYRLAVDERDVFIEAEFFHTDCFPINMTTGVLVRGIIQSGSGSSESSNHYYTTNRGEFPQSGCGNANGYGHDGAIMRRQRNQIAVSPPANPGDITPNTWRRQALAAFGGGPTQLRFWDEDNSAFWAALGFPDAGNILASGTDNQDVTGRGFVAVMTAQDQARLRNILVRRYVEPEPLITLGPQELFASPELTVFKTVRTVSDLINNDTNPYAIPGAIVEYEVRVVNAGNGAVDMDSLVITDTLPPQLQLVVAELSPGTGPVQFIDGAGTSSSGLGLTFTALGSNSDDIEFSTDGVNFLYAPTEDLNGTDGDVAFLRINPSGTMQAPAGGGQTLFSVRYRMRIP